MQFAREGIRVNALSPGPVNTPLLKELFAKDPERAARRLVHIPFGRFGEPEEIAAAVAFLASDDASLHHRVQLPRRRRHLRRLRHPALEPPSALILRDARRHAETDRASRKISAVRGQRGWWTGQYWIGRPASCRVWSSVPHQRQRLAVVDVQPVLRLEPRSSERTSPGTRVTIRPIRSPRFSCTTVSAHRPSTSSSVSVLAEPQRVDAAQEQQLGAVDVPDARDDGLVEEYGSDGHPSPLHPDAHRVDVGLGAQGVGAQGCADRLLLRRRDDRAAGRTGELPGVARRSPAAAAPPVPARDQWAVGRSLPIRPRWMWTSRPWPKSRNRYLPQASVRTSGSPSTRAAPSVKRPCGEVAWTGVPRNVARRSRASPWVTWPSGMGRPSIQVVAVRTGDPAIASSRTRVVPGLARVCPTSCVASRPHVGGGARAGGAAGVGGAAAGDRGARRRPLGASRSASRTSRAGRCRGWRLPVRLTATDVVRQGGVGAPGGRARGGRSATVGAGTGAVLLHDAWAFDDTSALLLERCDAGGRARRAARARSRTWSSRTC